LVYSAILTQEGTNPPVATVFTNTLGVTPEWSYVDVGQYILTATGVFTLDKLFIIIGNNSTVNYAVAFDFETGNEIGVNTYNWSTNAAANGGLYKTSIEIRVYP